MCYFVLSRTRLLLQTFYIVLTFNFLTTLVVSLALSTYIHTYMSKNVRRSSCLCEYEYLHGRILFYASEFWCKQNLDERSPYLKFFLIWFYLPKDWVEYSFTYVTHMKERIEFFRILMNRLLLRCKVSAIILQHIMASSKIVFTRVLMELMLL